MEEEAWDEMEDEGGEGGEGGEGYEDGGGEEGDIIDEPVEDGGGWNKEDFREDVIKESNEETVLNQPLAWEAAPPVEQTEPERPVPNRLPRREYGVRGFDVNSSMRKLAIGETLATNVGFGQSLRRMVREAWGSARPEGRSTLRSPVSKVRFTQTGTELCTTTQECIRNLQGLQKYYLELGFPDIPYNFMIGGDGVMYHGRGWNKQADRHPAFYRLKKACVDVAFIGNFIDRKIPFNMLAVATDFLKYGLKVNRITPFFQSFTYLSEGRRN